MKVGEAENPRRRIREYGIIPGILPCGPKNSITDIEGVMVGHITLTEGEDIRTGATAILPHAGNIFQEKVPAGAVVGNGFGKLAGITQLEELGEIETPIVLTNTLAVPRACEAVQDWVLGKAGNEEVRSLNPVVGETNDGYLNDIRRRALTPAMIRQAIETAAASPAEEGCVGAGTGTTAFGWKGGIGSSSRQLPEELGGYRVGALVQSNFDGILQIIGIAVGQKLGQHYLHGAAAPSSSGESIMIVLATDAPLSDRNLSRLARRSLAGLARTGAAMTNNSGDYVLAFSTAEAVRRTPERRRKASPILDLPNDLLSPLFLAAIEATEEAIYNSLFMAESMSGCRGSFAEALPVPLVISFLKAKAEKSC